MLSDEEKDNVFKISVPIITNEELERLDYTIKNDLDNIVHQISKTVSRDRDIIILKKVIEKQSKEIEEYNTKLLSNAGIYQLGFNDGKKTVENKIKAKIEEYEKNRDKAKITSIEYDIYVCIIEVLQSLLEKE